MEGMVGRACCAAEAGGIARDGIGAREGSPMVGSPRGLNDISGVGWPGGGGASSPGAAIDASPPLPSWPSDA